MPMVRSMTARMIESVYKSVSANAITGGILTIESKVLALTMPTEVSTSDS